ncbi:SDR family oxidoreductase [Rhodococcus coprophilus]|uniref:3-oxoacyl-[acyl-carrier-protein] reductase MabA n=1 Tax=Rhodococcus coprophilus TaxID=38310 RepID=A0A2X4TNU9_9NOCA|nr:SDR family oxidoreductase [Rhodococcus coprophilus]MBM7460776.1 3-oxoacyl-[acyl-carrier protein] reductase [Rhodococcus coprophilus]SQI28583.1 3-oxoacyl-ACP reductase [Rhodococcus coprophilus]
MSVLVLGGRGGLGASVVNSLTKEGVPLRYTSRSPTGGDDRELACEMSNPASLAACARCAIDELGQVKALVVMAGTMRDGLLISADPAALDEVIRVNLLGSMLAVQALLPHFIEHRYGRIVLVGSASGMRGSPGQANYAASKAGLIGLARSVTLEYAKRGITCNVISPGFIDAGMAAELSDKRRSDVLRQIPTNRLGRPEEIASAIKFLIDDASGYITGSVLTVDGGYGMGY